MQFIVIGLDGTDPKALERRMAVREEHIKMGDKLFGSGNLWYGAALLNDDGNMEGSLYILDFPSEKELKEYLAIEPYVTGKVWQNITIHKSNIRDPWQFNRPKEFYIEKQK